MPKISDPIQISKLTLKNRYVKAPTVCGHASEEGFVSDRLLDLYQAEARGGVGMVICHAAFIRQDGQGFRSQTGIYDDKCINGLNRLAETIQAAGARAAIQIFHAGAIAQPKIIGGRTPVSPSSIPLFLDPTQKTRALEDEEIEELARLYGVACARAKEAGFDAVEIHACHGSLIQQFLSPSFNSRTDRWGEDRLLFARRVIQEIRKAIGPDFPLLWRISAEEFIGAKGFTLKDTIESFLPAYLQEGISCVDVSA
ncbi:MAG: NADH:flavin oxidoreductase, partial [Candidatus Tectomicrobia bacterium]|nr:NADH:flavin oxidoreductase [Candidatus Tectomicrobia bacterium]